MEHINSKSLCLLQQDLIALEIAPKNAIPGTFYYMNVKDARRRRLQELKEQFGSLEKLALELNRGKRKPNKYLAQYLSQLHTGTRDIGDKFARRIETALAKAEGWMDHVGASSTEASELLSIWGQFPAEEQTRIIEELKIRLRVIRDKQHIHQALGDRPIRHTKPPSN